MKTGRNKYYQWGLTALLAAAPLAYAYFVFLPAQRTIAAMHEELKEERAYALRGTRAAAQLRKLLEEREQLEDWLARWSAEAIGPEQTPHVLGRLNHASEQAGVKILRLDPGAVERSEPLLRLPFRVMAEGEFHSLFEFIRQLEEAPWPAWIDELRMEKVVASRGESHGGKLRAEFMLQVFSPVVAEDSSSVAEGAAASRGASIRSDHAE